MGNEHSLPQLENKSKPQRHTVTRASRKKGSKRKAATSHNILALSQQQQLFALMRSSRIPAYAMQSHRGTKIFLPSRKKNRARGTQRALEWRGRTADWRLRTIKADPSPRPNKQSLSWKLRNSIIKVAWRGQWRRRTRLNDAFTFRVFIVSF